MNESAGGATAGTRIREILLVVEGGEFARHRLKAALRAPNREIYLAESGKEALSVLHAVSPDLIFVGLELPDLPGVRAVDVFLQRAPGVPVIAVSDAPDVSGAVEALRHGAADYIGLQEDHGRLLAATTRELQEARSTRALDRVRQQVRDQYGFNQLLTQSPRMLEVFDQIRAVAHTDATVLVRGETGTGKELVSRAIHDRSRRRDRPCIAVNCGAFTETLLESELFGHEKGSFTGAVKDRPGHFVAASGGTVFLDEIGDMPLEMQAKLLRVLQDGEVRPVGSNSTVKVDVRVVAATHRDLAERSRTGEFREDLFFRLNVITIKLPALRERPGDIAHLARYFLARIGEEMGKPTRLEGEALAALEAWHWPGNVRELENELQRAVALSSGIIGKEDLSPRVLEALGDGD